MQNNHHSIYLAKAHICSTNLGRNKASSMWSGNESLCRKVPNGPDLTPFPPYLHLHLSCKLEYSHGVNVNENPKWYSTWFTNSKFSCIPFINNVHI